MCPSVLAVRSERKPRWFFLKYQPTAAHAAATGGPPAAPQDTTRPDAATARFDAALAAWLPLQSAVLAAVDEVAAGRRRPESLAAARTVVAYVCPNGLGNKLPGEYPRLSSTTVQHATCPESGVSARSENAV